MVEDAVVEDRFVLHGRQWAWPNRQEGHFGKALRSLESPFGMMPKESQLNKN